jgi:hypothetical protein
MENRSSATIHHSSADSPKIKLRQKISPRMIGRYCSNLRSAPLTFPFPTQPRPHTHILVPAHQRSVRDLARQRARNKQGRQEARSFVSFFPILVPRYVVSFPVRFLLHPRKNVPGNRFQTHTGIFQLQAEVDSHSHRPPQSNKYCWSIAVCLLVCLFVGFDSS